MTDHLTPVDDRSAPGGTVLLLHSFFGKPTLLDSWAEALGDAGYRVVVPALPGRDPTDENTLRRSGFQEYLHAALAAYDDLGEDAIVVGHSLGGLLGQHIAAARAPHALVLLASVPPGILWPQVRSLPYLVPILPSIVAGRPFLPSRRTMSNVPLSTLPRAEQDVLIPQLVPDAGRVFRQMMLGVPDLRIRAKDIECPVLCVSGGSDRNVAPWMSRRLAKRLGAEHHHYPELPHWIVAESALGTVAPPILTWLSAGPNRRADEHQCSQSENSRS